MSKKNKKKSKKELEGSALYACWGFGDDLGPADDSHVKLVAAVIADDDANQWINIRMSPERARELAARLEEVANEAEELERAYKAEQALGL